MSNPTDEEIASAFDKLDDHDKFNIANNGWLRTALAFARADERRKVREGLEKLEGYFLSQRRIDDLLSALEGEK